MTGGSGFVGQRLVEMLVERGAKRVVSFDRAPRPADAVTSSKITYVQGDLTRLDDVRAACKEVDCVFHIAALVGPYHAKEAYVQVHLIYVTDALLRRPFYSFLRHCSTA